ncbi:MAG TPA: hypothetical protein ENJ63_00565, partial [Dissulfuribacter thermophilus]|nr:hypothetical protein [Dissulfuribacter thermophilus]
GRILSRMESVGTRILSTAISPDGKRIGFGFTLREKKPNYAGPLEFSFDLRVLKLKKISSEKGLLRATDERDGLKLSLNPLLSQMMGLYYLQSLLEVKKGGETLARILRHTPDGYRHDCFGFVNDRLMISGGMNGKVFVYNLRGEKVAELVGHEGEVWAVAVTPDGKWAVTGGDDQTVRIWYLGDIKDVSWGDEGVDWERLKEADPRNWKKLYPQRKALASLRSSDPLTWRALVNSLKDAYMPIKKIYPTLTLFPSKDGKEWVAWTPDGYFTGSSPSALRLIGYHINQGFYKQARWLSFSQLYDIYFRPDLIKHKLENPTVDLSKKSGLPSINDYLLRRIKLESLDE